MNERVKPQGCVLRATAISGRLQGLLGEITIAQTYQNAESVNIEAVFTFPVPVEAVLLGVDIQIDDRLLQGRVLPRRQAENAYEDAVSGGDGAILLQEAGRGLYTVSVGNLLPGQTAKLRYRYALLSVWNGDTLRLQLPTTIAPRYGDPGQAGLQPHQIPAVDLDADNRFSLELELGGPLRQATVESPSHRISVEVGAEVLRVRLAGGPALMDRDFILNIQGSAEARAALGLCAPDRDGWVALASFQSELAGHADAGGRDCVLIADCSGSMAGDSIAQTRAALLAILDRLQPADRFNLIAFGSQPRAFFTGLHSADDRGLAQARALVAGLDANMGGTEIGAALQLAYRQRQGGALDILLMTDGEAWNAEALAVEARQSSCRIFTVGVGAAVAEGLVRGLAEATGGACEFVHPNEDMAARIVRHFERIRAPRAEAAMTWPVEPTRRLPERIERVFSGDTLHLLAWLPTRPEGPATLNLTLSDGRCLPQTVTLEPWPVAETADTLPRLAAARRIARLSAEDATVLAVQYQLVTPHTHFLMVDVRAEGEKATELPELRAVPHMLAAGWGGVGSVAAAAPCMAAMEPPAFERTTLLRRQRLSCSPPAPLTAPPPMPGAAQPSLSGGARAMFDALREMATSAPKAAQKSLLGRAKTMLDALRKEAPPPTPPLATTAGTPAGLARWLEANAAQLADAKQPLPTLDELAHAGLPGDLLTRLRERVAQGETEDAVVAALLHAFLQNGPECQLPRNASRAIRSRFQKQVSATLAAAVEPLVKTWCATG
ncbi:MAG: VIT domain-containing protein [Candidatus Competibacteraceae bacterium]